MEQIFNFDCFALLVDDWSIPSEGEVSEPENEPKVVGFFTSTDDAANHAVKLEKLREAAHEKECERWRSFRPDKRQNSYFIIAVNNLKLRKGDGLSQVDDYLIDAAKLMAQGIGGGPLEMVYVLGESEMPNA